MMSERCQRIIVSMMCGPSPGIATGDLACVCSTGGALNEGGSAADRQRKHLRASADPRSPFVWPAGQRARRWP